jgi:hypothetical protein
MRYAVVVTTGTLLLACNVNAQAQITRVPVKADFHYLVERERI